MTHDGMDNLDEQKLWSALRLPAPSRPARPGKCPSQAELACWLDGTASAELAERIDTHLTACPECLAAISEVRGLLRGGRPVLVPPEVLAAGRSLVAPDVAGARGWKRRLMPAMRWAAAVAAAVVVGYCGYLAGGQTWRYRDAAEAAVVAEASFGISEPAAHAPADDLDELLLEGGAQ
jgi:predicted anti-sigma-YlaC factor YlaD